jgi:hypothetical protein
MAKPKMSRLMTLQEVARGLLGMDGQWAWRKLLRQIQRIERRDNVRILVVHGQGSHRRYYVTLATLREHVPDFFYRRDEAQERLREYQEELEERMERIREEMRIVAGRFADRYRNHEGRLRTLEARPVPQAATG